MESNVFSIVLLISAIPIANGAIPGHFFWKPRLGIDLALPTTEVNKFLAERSKENVQAGLVVLIDTYSFGMSIVALVCGATSANTLPHLNPMTAYFYTTSYRWALRHLSMLLTGHGRCNYFRKKWGWTDSALCECGEEDQTMEHIISRCPIYSYAGPWTDLVDLPPEAVSWLGNLNIDLMPMWLGGKGGSYCDTHKHWRRRFFYMDEFVPKYLRYLLPYVKKEQWEQEEKEMKLYKRYSESAFGKHYRYPTKVFNNFTSFEASASNENDISSSDHSAEG